MGIIAWIVFGLLAGIVAKLIMPGRDPGGLIVSLILGVLGAIVGGWIAERDQAEVLGIFGRAEVTASPVYEIEDIIADTHIRERGVIVDLPDGDVEAAPMHNVLPRLSGTPGTFRLPAPGLGEHTGALLAELGIAEVRQAELKQRGVI